MSTPVLSSTFLLTLLLAIGLFFFIRASVKDRTQQVKLVAATSEDSLLTQLGQYMQARSYKVATVDAEQHQVTFQGIVRPSLFLATLLTVLAICGTLCLSLVLSQLYPAFSNAFLGLVLLAPLAGVYYWKKAERPEQVFLQVEEITNEKTGIQSIVTVTAHRDELLELQRALSLKPSPGSASGGFFNPN
ncbi:MAG: cofactor assembly of complex C subunit B [Kastovskya adunca ATA6-11-RM4]|nr:cofactor assembly of complex C subunit B [Kastovskya adunca ATA6-11-RM4]